MNQGTNQNQNQSNNEVLYDVFLKEEGAINEAQPSRILSFLHARKPSSDSADVSVNYLESPDSAAVHSITRDDEIKEFVHNIYEPVKRSNDVCGFDYDEKTLKMWLLNEETHGSFKLFGVVGMLGVGKTTLCRMILNDEQVKQRYFPRLLITMPPPESGARESMERVVRTMLEHLGVEEETIESINKDHQLPGLLYALYLQLEGKKFLIVLDDVKEEEGNYYEQLARCLVNGHGFFPKGDGAAVILNSRNEKAIKEIVGGRNVHRIELLSQPEDCWEIYQATALGDRFPRPSPSREVQEELKKKCGGLPLAARIMGELKRRENIQKETLQQSEPSGSGEGSNVQSSEAAEASTGSGPQNHGN